jgi:Fuc2NAc and GlcNAc transferase
MNPVLWFGLTAVGTYLLTRSVRRYSLQRSILDVPNDRSLHEAPVARGGGVAVVACFQTAAVLLALTGQIPGRWAVALLGGGLLVALIGWLDDRSGVQARIRALVHFVAACWALWWLGGLPGIWLGGWELRLPVIGNVLATIGVVWWINLYNFMDGIDGLAGGQAVTVAGSAGVLMLLTGNAADALPAFALAGAAAGFLVLNWYPARIFLGDVGSGFLGFAFATLAIATERAGALPLLVWVLLSGVFIVDSTVTLLRRVLRGERWHEAHRSHAYQRLVLSGRSHGRVTAAVLGINGILTLAAVRYLYGGSMLEVLALAGAVLGGAYLWVERVRPMWLELDDDSSGGNLPMDARVRGREG